MSEPTPPEPSTPQDPKQSVLIPVKLDAFIFNKAVCSGDPPPVPEYAASRFDPVGAKIAPIEQPNYTFLRLNSTLIQPDILNPIELHNSWPGEYNSRYTNLGTQQPYSRRIGVYLSWTLPRLFRGGVAAAGKEAVKSQSFAAARASRGLEAPASIADEGDNKDENKPNVGHAPPVFPSVPNRWLVIRHIPDKTTIRPVKAQSKVPEFASWVIESDRQWELKDLGVEVDLQTDVSPFIAAGGNDEKTVSKQAEVFIGKKTPLQGWNELYKPEKPKPSPSAKPGDDKGPQFLPHFSLLSSSNQMFADYQPHNSNVFSMCDNFEYANNQYMTQATAHYYVVGWNADPKDDLFNGTFLGTSKLSRKERLKTLKLKIKMETSSDGKQATDSEKEKAFEIWLDNEKTTRAVCHGAMYEVQWDVTKKPDYVPADTFSTQLNTTMPLAVGTSPLDALTTFARAHTCVAPPEPPEDKEKVTIPKLEKWITALERHLLARDDGVETQNQASDMVYNWNYARTDGGQNWNASGLDTSSTSSDKPGGTPKELIKTLRFLNGEQIFLDAVLRSMTRLRRDMFSLWWRCVTDTVPDNANDPAYKAQVHALEERFNALEEQRKDCLKNLKTLLDTSGSKVKPGARPAFYQQRDPTLLVGGVKSGWQHDYLDDLLVRIDEQVVRFKEEKGKVAPIWKEFDQALSGKLPEDLQPTIKSLVSEFLVFRPGEPQQPDLSAKDITSPPLFHEEFSSDNPRPAITAEELKPQWRDRWNQSQPWFPLFLEWEIEYYHVPFEKWNLSEADSRSSALSQLRYNIPDCVDLSERVPKDPPKQSADSLNKDSDDDKYEERDKHLIQGRVLLLPQPSFSLAAKIQQLFDGTPQPLLDRHENEEYDYLKKEDREALQKGLHQLAFLSAPLAGLSAHLTTVLQGNHIKPNMRNGRTGELMPIIEACRSEAGFGDDQLKIIDIETDSTPFGYNMRPPTGKHSLFKPATHGQFRFTKLNIIDKFGQAIHAIDPTPQDEAQAVWPCISEWYAPQKKKDESPNIIIPRQPAIDDKEAQPPTCPAEPPKPCEFIQIPPMINQSARLNASFVVRVGSEKEDEETDPKTLSNSKNFWRPADEWENPIWGWVLINYANQGIQLFTQDGTFYREVRFGGPKGTQGSPAWLPFRPPSATALADAPAKNGPETMQLERLVARLGDVDFLRAFWNMVVLATDNMLPAPEAYASFTNSALIGRPLALTHAGWSLELASDQQISQANKEKDIPRRLLGKDSDDLDSDAENDDPSRYAFKVKIGDVDRGFDGLVGMFNCSRNMDPQTSTDLGVRLEVLYSDYQPKEDPNTSEEKKYVAPTRPLVLRPCFPSPENYSTAEGFASQRNSHLSVRAMVVDPFSPVHAYSGILPVKEIILAPWTWQSALSKMKAFFHMGPLMITKDVPPQFDSDRELRSDKPVTGAPPIPHEEGAVLLPGVGKGDWAWLQPYYPQEDEKEKPTAMGDGEEEEALERYMVLPIAAEDERARFDPGPYTAVEGYLMKVGNGTEKGKEKA